MRLKDIERFESKIELIPFSECWWYMGGLGWNGYGQFHAKGKNVRAHRYAYSQYVGDIPDGCLVCHSCDNPSCVNPAHLWLGSPQENMADKKQKGRAYTPCGEDSPLSKVTEEDVMVIKRMYRDGVRQTAIAAEYGIAQSTVSAICTGTNWSHTHAS